MRSIGRVQIQVHWIVIWWILPHYSTIIIISRSTSEAHRIYWNRGRSIENQLFELLGLLDPDPEQPNSTNRMRRKDMFIYLHQE